VSSQKISQCKCHRKLILIFFFDHSLEDRKNPIYLEHSEIQNGQKSSDFVTTVSAHYKDQPHTRIFCGGVPGQKKMQRNIIGLSVSFGGLPIGHSMMLLQIS